MLVLAFGLLFGLVSAEIICKIIDLRAASQFRRISSPITRPSRIPGVRFELIPGASGFTPGDDKIIRVNRLGFRGPELAAAKPPGIYRLAVLGDSIAFARYLDNEDSFPDLLPGRLAERRPGLRFEVLNVSLGGRDTWEEVALLEHQVLALEPDLVVLQVCMNDHMRLPSPDPNRRRGMYGERPLFSYSSLFDLLDRKYPGFRKWHVAAATRLGFDMRSSDEVVKEFALDKRHILDIGPDWPEWHREFLRANELCRARGADFLIAVFPTSYQIERSQEQSVPELTALAREHGIPLVDLLQPFRTAGAAVLKDYTHPTKQGHALAADVIAEAIQREFLDRSGPANSPSR